MVTNAKRVVDTVGCPTVPSETQHILIPAALGVLGFATSTYTSQHRKVEFRVTRWTFVLYPQTGIHMATIVWGLRLLSFLLSNSR